MATAFAIVPEAIKHAIDASSDAPSSSPNSGLPFIRLPHPRTNLPSLYLPQPSTSDSASRILEVQKVSPDVERSWFFGDRIIADGSLITMTPVDPLFLLIPLLRAVFTSETSDGVERFRTQDDIFDVAVAQLAASDESLPPSQTHFDSPVRKSTTSSKGKEREDRPITSQDITMFAAQDCVGRALSRACETKEVADGIVVFRYSPSKLLSAVQQKVTKLSDPSVFNTFSTLQRTIARAGLADGTSNVEEETREELSNLARIKASCDVVGQYLPPDLLELLLKFYDFTPLDKHIAAAEPMDTPMEPSTTASKKSNKPKKEPAAAKKNNATGPSRAAEALRKVDTKGMNKLSSFFKKK
ncbi:hypothetical protein DL93DRAFT_2224399 [Clavulina sp. PMI_390]|nr:hypothetical protein DL93DRAFT_2224399 [Clavulina sp. PMI_390]